MCAASKEQFRFTNVIVTADFIYFLKWLSQLLFMEILDSPRSLDS